MNHDRVAEYRHRHVPLFNDQKLKLGLFSINTSNAMMATTAETGYRVTWEHTRQIARQADAMGFEILVPVGRWRGFGGEIDFAGECFETYTWAAGIAEATEKIMVCATSHVPTVHPIVAAKQSVTIDHISGGRFGLNVVMGWFTPEMEMFGAKQREHDLRYQYGAEWLDIVKKIWTAKEPFDFDGEFFHLRGLRGAPKPLQKPHPVVINAGSSPAGIDFSARLADVNFVGMGTFEMGRDAAAAVRKKAREEYGREIRTMTHASVVCRDTEKEARKDYQYMVDKIDWVPIDYFTKVFGLEAQSYGDAEAVRRLRTQFAMGWGNMTFVGSPEQVVDQFKRVSDLKIDGVVIGFLDYVEEMKHFETKVMPLLKQAGLRT